LDLENGTNNMDFGVEKLNSIFINIEIEDKNFLMPDGLLI
jgi:hypothetical protein